VERIILLVDLEHDHDGVKGRDEEGDGPGEPIDVALRVGILDRQKGRDNQGPDRNNHVAEVKHEGEAEGSGFEDLEQLEVALPD